MRCYLADTYTDRDPYTECHAHAGDTDTYRNCHANSQRDGDADINSYSDADLTDTDAASNTKAAAHAARKADTAVRERLS